MTMETVHLYEGRFASVRIAICQIATEPWELEGNLQNTIGALNTAGKEDAEIAITPECVLHGYANLKNTNDKQKLFKIAEDIDGERINKIKSIAKEQKMHIVLGFAERQDEKIYNTAILISNQGRIIQKYRKVHCRDFESAEHDGVFSSGSDFFVSKIDCRQTSLNAGLMICFDREIPESARCLRKLGAEFIFCPLATNTSKMTNYTDHINNEMITRCRAAENELYIAVVNHAKRFNGGSFVVGPTGELVCQLDQNPQVKILEIPVELVRQKFHSNPLGWMGLGYSRPEIYKKYGSLES